MALVSVRCRHFRCLEDAALSLGRGNNLIVGPNAAGKTSLLEAIAYLSRGRSFRGANVPELVQNGETAFVVTGKVSGDGREIALGVQNGADGLVLRLDGERARSVAELAERLPVQVIDPDVHDLVAGGPDNRRRYLDWIAFHVEHAYLATWRRFRRALRQRNAALKNGPAALTGWDEELAELGEAVDRTRRSMIERVAPLAGRYGEALLGSPVSLTYQQGWLSGSTLADALRQGRERDRQTGNTQSGPHRADIRLLYDEQKARKRVSRGQQKLLASAMVLAATELVQGELARPMTLLLDDPAAELDSRSLAALMAAVNGLDAQVIATALTAEATLFDEPPVLFHVEQGVVTGGA